MNITLSIIAILLLIISIYANYNLIRKQERFEDIVENQQKYIISISKLVKESREHLEELDEKGAFQSDDEVGFFFLQLKAIQDELSLFILSEDKNEETSK